MGTKSGLGDVRHSLGSKLNYTFYKYQIKLGNSDMIIEFEPKKRNA
jgi:hypothetical protein